MKEFEKLVKPVNESDNNVKCDCCGAKSKLTVDVWVETWLCKNCIADLCNDFD